jgi:periplasmic divalent cation tolerance protein
MAAAAFIMNYFTIRRLLMPYQLVLSTCPDQAVADRLARLLLENNLTACVNVVPGLMSIYRWQGQIERSQEFLLLIKTVEDQYQAVETCIRKHHPYELPEIIAIPIEQGLPEYLRWIDSCITLK